MVVITSERNEVVLRTNSGRSAVAADRMSEAPCLLRLLHESAAGHEPAFAELYQRTQARVHGVVLRLLRSLDHAREVVQETYLEVWLNTGLYDQAKGSVMGWLTMIARRRAVDRIRYVESCRTRDAGHADLHHALPVFDIADEVAAEVDARFIRQALTSLSPIQRQAVVMKYVEGHTLNQMSVLLAIPLGTVKTRVRDGLSTIRKFVRETPVGVVSLEPPRLGTRPAR